MPTTSPVHRTVRLRAFEPRDAGMVRDLATDSYVPLTGSLVGQASTEQALAWIGRQHDRLVTGTGFSFCVADLVDDRALGQVGLWLAGIADGTATAGYGIAPRERGRGLAAQALTAVTRFAWSIPELHRVELSIEPWNLASLRTAERAGYRREGMLRSHRLIGDRLVDMAIYVTLRPAGAAADVSS
ncbi:GNAT family N-acetyltransferase [Cellulomonas cellasea]|uniref:RimJ/RimL family protein N-acetyltransferase n=1 Tax=Cellulomonas cellasea TaxID=43670 RepID=A0A7W4YCE0_9CELL|nr:GNAT family protein [Cellulomonas cellasea]MBB2923471.1 RimJ/RimL family protein N-acetyltransferase [Cellulomonas cellasea]